MSRILVVVGHSRLGTYCEALGEAYARGGRAGGHDVTLVKTAGLEFDPVLRGAYVELQELEPDLQIARRALTDADHIVIIFPLWMGTMPAILKGFLERILQPDLFAAAKEGRFIHPLKGKSARIIVTMGMPGFIYRWWFGTHALSVIKHNILKFLGVSPVRTTIHGGVETVHQTRREAWLAEAEELGRSLR